jgi:hypothetical protein
MCNTITNSSQNCFKECKRKYLYAYELKYRPITEGKALRIGSITHEGLDQLAKGVPLDMVCDAIQNTYEAKAEYNEELMLEAVTVCCLLRGYANAWANSPVEILESETTFELPIINQNGNAMTGFRQAGKRDRVCRLPDGRIALMETKTVGEDISAGSDYRNVLAINSQISMYINAAREQGLEIETSLYDCIRKPTIRPTKNAKPMTPGEWNAKLTADIAERPEYYFQRFEVPRLDSDIEEFKSELADVAKDILECRRSKRWYRNTGNCRKWSSLCKYYGICSGQISIENGCPDGFRVAETEHEELAETVSA